MVLIPNLTSKSLRRNCSTAKNFLCATCYRSAGNELALWCVFNLIDLWRQELTRNIGEVLIPKFGTEETRSLGRRRRRRRQSSHHCFEETIKSKRNAGDTTALPHCSATNSHRDSLSSPQVTNGGALDDFRSFVPPDGSWERTPKSATSEKGEAKETQTRSFRWGPTVGDQGGRS